MTLKGMRSPGWEDALRRALRHRITVVRAGVPDRHGMPTAGEEFELPCLIQGSRARVISADSTVIQASHMVEFGPEIEIKNDDQLKNGRDRKGATLLASGRVIRVEPSLHPTEGLWQQSVAVQML